MNNITFTGVKNICYCIERTVDMNDFNNQERWMNIELTGHDLHKFRAALKRSCLPRKHYTNPLKDNFLHINTYSIPGEDCIAINNNILEVNDETLPMFTELARLMRKISDKDEKEFVVDKSYLYSKLFNTSIFMDNEIDNYSAAKMHNAFKVKKGAKAINKLIQRIMERYFAE